MATAISQDDYLNDTSQFDLARKKAADQSTANLQARKDALARRFASLGNLDSGVQMKQEELAANDEASNLTNANEGINAQQQAELGRRKEVIQGQQFQSGEAAKGRDFTSAQAALQRQYGTSERLGSQDYASQQAAIQRKYGTSERLGSQGFAADQAKLGRDFTTSERLGSQTFSADEAQKQRDVQIAQFEKTYGLSMDQFAAAKDQFDRTFGEEVRINDKNIDFAQQALDKKGPLDKLTDASSWGKSLTGGMTSFLFPGLAANGNAIGDIKDTFSSWV